MRGRLFDTGGNGAALRMTLEESVLSDKKKGKHPVSGWLSASVRRAARFRLPAQGVASEISSHCSRQDSSLLLKLR